MLKRKMSRTLQDWKDAGERTVFIMLGAHHTGKTCTIRAFAHNQYSTLVEVNFAEREEVASYLAEADSADELVSRLGKVAGHSIEPGTLVFFDEAQQLGQGAVALSKLLLQDNRIDLVLSSSLLGTPLEGKDSFPEDTARFARMYPLDFEEFCWAVGVPDSEIAEISRCYAEKKPLDESLHERLMLTFRQYIVVGGMPESVQRFIDSDRSIEAARQSNSQIMELYRYDTFSQMPSSKPKSRSIFEDISDALAKLSKRLETRRAQREADGSEGQGSKAGAQADSEVGANGSGHVDGNGKDGDSFSGIRGWRIGSNAEGGDKRDTSAGKDEQPKENYSWLVDTGFSLTARAALEPRRPLRPDSSTQKRYKLYSCDCGLLISRYSPSVARQAMREEGDANSVLVFAYENVIAQQLASEGFPLFFYNGRKGKIDFLIEDRDGSVIPIEVMAGDDYKEHLALDDLLDSEGNGIDRAYVLSEHNVSCGERAGKAICYLPLYMSMCFENERDDDLSDLHLEEMEE